MEHLTIFIYVCTLVPDVKREKLDHKLEVGIFFGIVITPKFTGYSII